MEKLATFTYHYFLDEAGDSTFYGKGKTPILGGEGVSGCFILGLLKINEPLDGIRKKVIDLQNQIAADPYYDKILSILKKKAAHGYYLHAKDDVPEVRKSAYELIQRIDCSFEAVVARKLYYLYEHKHNGNQAEFYADLLSHLLKKRLWKYDRLVLNIAEQRRCTALNNLQKGLNKAMAYSKSRYLGRTNNYKVVFNVQKPTTEPLLNIADYLCWSIQRVFETGETRYYDYISNKISVVWDIYDFAGTRNGQNYYSKARRLTEANCIKEKSPKMH
ncbi:MAG TPA: DUF3800 domain-containing protein [Puia sp.]|nr:DUF3800 domain-containing protein [Puia sp.]